MTRILKITNMEKLEERRNVSSRWSVDDKNVRIVAWLVVVSGAPLPDGIFITYCNYAI
jgi:hypothetical protein